MLTEEEKLEEILNSKKEYGHIMIPRIRIEVGTRIMKDEELEAYRRQKVIEDLEEDREWEQNEAGKLAGKRDGEKIENSRAKRIGEAREEDEGMGTILKDGEGTGEEDPRRNIFSNLSSSQC